VSIRSIPLSDIIIPPNRQRQEFNEDALEELKASIESIGLLHPPVLRQTGDRFALVAGERRLRAIADIFALGGVVRCDGKEYTDQVPFSSLGELDELAAEEAELDENLRRKDLTWQETAAAHDRLHMLRAKQKAALTSTFRETLVAGGVQAPVASAPTQSYADTAKEVFGRSDGAYQDTIRKEVIVAKHLSNPAVAKAKTLDEAFKVLKRQEQADKNTALAAEVGATFNAGMHVVRNVNCLEAMQELVAQPELHFDVILTDPPYGMGADDFGDAGGKLTGIEHHYDDSYESWKQLMDGANGWCSLSYRVAKPQAHAYVFCDIDRYHELREMMRTAGWYVHRTPIINHKLNSGRVPLPDRGPRRQYELVLYAIKGNKPTTHIYPDVVSTGADENMTHGAQKPVALYQNLLQRSVKPGDRVADFFGGSGTLLEAAHGYKCLAYVTEQSKEYYGMCLRRVQRLHNLEQPGLF
jgi:DNA modification methylase/ParB-like chromosome segregation protein Spo0J